MALDKFLDRHIGPREDEILSMLNELGMNSLNELTDKTIPEGIRLDTPMNLQGGMSEYGYQKHIKSLASKNKIYRSYIGMGYYRALLPAVIKRNILENPGWYTSYTPYQAEISQGRLEALLNFQTMVMELTAMEIANASLLDEATAAAEAMIMLYNARGRQQVKAECNKFFVDQDVFPQTLELLMTRAEPLDIKLVTGDFNAATLDSSYFGVQLQYPSGKGQVHDYKDFVESAKSSGIRVSVVADLMSLVLLNPPGQWGADVVAGSSQRFGIPMGYGGPHAAFFATREEFKRYLPGRIIGVSVDREGKPALRMALQTREQHIKRERATSNICTAQALLASMAGMYAIYHGAGGLRRIAMHIHSAAGILAESLEKLGYREQNKDFFDTLCIGMPEGINSEQVRNLALDREMNFRYLDENTIGISLDEATLGEDLNEILEVFAIAASKKPVRIKQLEDRIFFGKKLQRQDSILEQEVFNKYRSETELMRYIKSLENKDISLTRSMISLGSCTMKLNASVQLYAMTWPEFADIHPFVPLDQVEGYQELLRELAEDLKAITGFAATSFMPNSGASGEYTGLLVIRKYLHDKDQKQRNVVLIPASAHGTNPASGVMAGMEVKVVRCDEKGNIDITHLRQLAEEHKDRLAAFMITYPSTHGVFEARVKEMMGIIHDNGGQVYMDGANMNAQVGLTNPALIGADVCHLNLHKTFAIPHGGGGPGMGPIGVADHLVEYLPTHPIVQTGGMKGIHAVAAAPWGSASILTISHAYCKLLGEEGLTRATQIALLNANYLAAKLKEHYKILYTGEKDMVGHEFILECRNFKTETGISEADIAKRLMDYGFHAPTLSFPVHGTLMVEPTESESKAELDRFIEAMASIAGEICRVRTGDADAEDNVLKNAPHTATMLVADEWTHPYSRKYAAFPLPWVETNKFWCPAGRIDNAYGDRNLVCSCEPVENDLP